MRIQLETFLYAGEVSPGRAVRETGAHVEDAHVHRRTVVQSVRPVDGGLVAFLAGLPVRAGADGAAAAATEQVLHCSGIECGKLQEQFKWYFNINI